MTCQQTVVFFPFFYDKNYTNRAKHGFWTKLLNAKNGKLEKIVAAMIPINRRKKETH